ncbi:MAG TPA: hypothetical protein VGR37_16165 [Longimicrobiaceae bacterium]|nr:hypothetical protein [Longimicrobiaceae bacterium]
MMPADSSAWWTGTEGIGPIPISGVEGPVVGLNVVSDWLGSEWVLTPPVEALAGVPLTAPAFGEPLVWRDAVGAPAVVLRVWQVRSDAYEAEPLAYEGLDLLMRPDLYGHVCAAASVPVREFRTVESEELEGIRAA